MEDFEGTVSSKDRGGTEAGSLGRQETVTSEGPLTLNLKPVLGQLKQKLAEDIGTAVKRRAGMDRTRAHISWPTSSAVEVSKEVEAGFTKQRSAENKATTSPTILDLPWEMLLEIFQHLDYFTVARCAQVCTKFNRISKDPKLFRDISIVFRGSRKRARWVLDRAVNPRVVSVRNSDRRDVITPKLSTWSNLIELELLYVDLRNLGDIKLKYLRYLTVYYCDINCGTLKNLFGHIKAVCGLVFSENNCFQCGESCRTDIISLTEIEACVHSLEAVKITRTSDISLADLNRLSLCTNLKRLSLRQNFQTTDRRESALAMEMVAIQCNKLESIFFDYLPYITDYVLKRFFNNCKYLKNVDLHLLPNITQDSCLIAIHMLPQLEIMKIIECDLISEIDEINLKNAVENLKCGSSTKNIPQLHFDVDCS